MSSIYIHIPFCKKRCIYCDFHFVVSKKKVEELINSIIKEIRTRKDYLKDKKLSSIYFGGGTPSIISTSLIKKILKNISDVFIITENTEITIETNPDDINKKKLEGDEASYRRAISKIKINSNFKFKDHAKSISEFFNVSKSFKTNSEEIKILENFNFKINKGDRIGILGGNGSGKTTFLKLLLKEEIPDKGTIKNFKNIEFSYFDQKRSDLILKETIKKNICPSGGDYINVMGKDRHVYGYLKEFQFDPKILNDYVSTLSGGQKNRLMLAKILANPKSCLILDEPTNDLDMDTLDLLEEILINYKGTLIIVSHDRDFLDQTVTRILAFQGDGNVIDCIGGYSDYLKLKKNSFKNKNLIKHDSKTLDMS